MKPSPTKHPRRKSTEADESKTNCAAQQGFTERRPAWLLTGRFDAVSDALWVEAEHSRIGSARSHEHFFDDDVRRKIDAEDGAIRHVFSAHHLGSRGGVRRLRAFVEQRRVNVAGENAAGA